MKSSSLPNTFPCPVSSLTPFFLSPLTSVPHVSFWLYLKMYLEFSHFSSPPAAGWATNRILSSSDYLCLIPSSVSNFQGCSEGTLNEVAYVKCLVERSLKYNYCFCQLLHIAGHLEANSYWYFFCPRSKMFMGNDFIFKNHFRQVGSK